MSMDALVLGAVFKTCLIAVLVEHIRGEINSATTDRKWLDVEPEKKRAVLSLL